MTNNITKLFLFAAVTSLVFTACKKDDDEETVQGGGNINTVPEFYNPAPESEYGKTAPFASIILGPNESVRTPWDLSFNPNKTGELWVLNHGTSATGGSTVIAQNAGKENQTSEYRKDGNSWHFMALATSIDFGTNGNFGTAQGIQDANQQGGTFTGPTLWTADLDIYAKVGNPPTPGINGSHLDMLHGSPYGMGIAHDVDNVYWVFDGYNGHLVRYDFKIPHVVGGDDHADGCIHRYTEVELSYFASIPSHMVLDKATGWLYIAETAKNRIIRVNTKTGSKKSDLATTNEPLAEHWQMTGVEWEVFIDAGLKEPSGIEFKDGRVFVSNYENGEIHVYSAETKEKLASVTTQAGIMGIQVGPDGKLWFVNSKDNGVYRLDPQ